MRKTQTRLPNEEKHLNHDELNDPALYSLLLFAAAAAAAAAAKYDTAEYDALLQA